MTDTHRIVKHTVRVDDLEKVYRDRVGVPEDAELTFPTARLDDSVIGGDRMLLSVEFVWEWDDPGRDDD